MSTYFTIYKTTNNINGKFYIGQHQTNDAHDSYLGSGTAIKDAVKKYGKSNFTKEVLFVFDNFNEMNDKENAIVTESMIKDPLCYNQVPGGQGDNVPGLHKYIRTPDHCKALSESKKGIKCDPKVVAKRAKTCKDNRAKMTKEERSVRFGHNGEKNGFFNKKHSNSTLIQIRETIGDSRKGSKNPNAKTITIDGETYHTHKECMEALGLSKRQLKKLKQKLGDL